MPSSPVFLQGRGKIRAVEVLRNLDPHDLSDTYGYIYSSGKVGVKLRCIEYQEEKGVSSAICARISYDSGNALEQAIRDDELLEIPKEDPGQTIGNILPLKSVRNKERVLKLGES